MKKMKMLLIALFAFYNLGGQLSWGVSEHEKLLTPVPELPPPMPVPLLNCDKGVDIDIASQKNEGEGIDRGVGVKYKDYCRRHNIIVRASRDVFRLGIV